MTPDTSMLERWLRATFSRMRRSALGRGLVFAKYRLDSRRPPRHIERELRQKLRARLGNLEN